MRNVFVKKLCELAEEDPKIFLVVGDIGFGVFEGFVKKFPKQFLNVGVAEQNMTGIATGLALEGRVIFIYSIANFATLRCLEQIRNDACYHDANVKVVSMGSGFSYGVLGISHHATEDLGILRTLPHMTVVSPGDDWEASEATAALAKTPGTFYLRLDRSPAGLMNMEDEVFRLGKARRLREGSDITLIGTGSILTMTLRAADLLLTRGIQCGVLSMHTIKPLDIHAVLSAASETGGIVTIEEHTIVGGLGSAVAEACMEGGVLPRVFFRIGLRDEFSSIVGSQDYLRARYGMDASSIATVVQKLLNHRL